MEQTIESVLVPTDGSRGARAGVRRGIDLAARVDAELHTLSVVDTREVEPSLSDLGSDSPTDQEDLIEEAERAVEAVAELARNHLTRPVTTAVEWGVPFQSITEYADAHDIDIIVMGTHGRTGIEQFLLGSVAEKTLRTAGVPVLTVPPSADTPEIGDVEYENVLLPTDGSEAAEIAVDWGIALAEMYDATVQTVYSVDTSRFPSSEGMADLHDALERIGRDALEGVRESARASGVSIAANLGNGPAARMILSYADDHEVDLIVMGTHGRSGVDRYLIGSVTEEVVRNANVPVCCVPMTDAP